MVKSSTWRFLNLSKKSSTSMSTSTQTTITEMTQTVCVRFSYEDKVSEEIPIHVELDLSRNSNRKKLMNRLLKSNPNITEVSFIK
jgi:hypothetical protein